MAKVIFVKDISPTTGSFQDLFQLSEVQRKTASNLKDYLILKLRDKTGELDGRMWDNLPKELPKVGDYVSVRAFPEVYQGSLQIRVSTLVTMPKSEVIREDFLPASARDRKEMLLELETLVVENVSDEKLTRALLALMQDSEIREKLKDCPAAKGNHQAYLGGLLEHILRLCDLVLAIGRIYEDLNLSVLLAAALVHDVGKIEELVYEDFIGYSRRGTLVGHIILGSQIWSRFSGELDSGMKDHIAHIIASHHGRLEWEAAKLPMTREAVIFHQLDMIDSQYELIGNALKEVDEEGFSAKGKLAVRMWNGR